MVWARPPMLLDDKPRSSNALEVHFLPAENPLGGVPALSDCGLVGGPVLCRSDARVFLLGDAVGDRLEQVARGVDTGLPGGVERVGGDLLRL
jgi:hypothetical protein